MIGKALGDVFSAKTLTFWIILSLIAFAAFVVLVIVAVVFERTFEGYYQALLAFLGIGGGAGTTRGVVSDGIMPRLAMIEGAKTDPSVALGSPTPMTLKTDASSAASTQPSATLAPFVPPGG